MSEITHTQTNRCPHGSCHQDSIRRSTHGYAYLKQGSQEATQALSLLGTLDVRYLVPKNSQSRLTNRSQGLLTEVSHRKLQLSARAHHRILKIARTIADMEAKQNIAAKHLLEAINYRCMDRCSGINAV